MHQNILCINNRVLTMTNESIARGSSNNMEWIKHEVLEEDWIQQELTPSIVEEIDSKNEMS